MTQRFYFHDATSSVGGTLPSAMQASAGTVKATGADTPRTMDGTIGAGQTSASLNTVATTSEQINGFRMFVSPPLAAQTYPTGQTISFSFGAQEANNASDMFEGGCAWVYFWRPSTGAQTGAPITGLGFTGGIMNEPGTSQSVCTGSIASSGDITILSGDVVICEVWSRQNQTMGNSYANTFFYDGTTEGSTSNIASYVDLGTDIALYVPQRVPRFTSYPQILSH